MISVEIFIFIDIFPTKTYNNIRDGKPSSGEFLPDSGKLYIQESSCQIVENFINQEIPCQTVGNFKIEGWSLWSPFSLQEIPMSELKLYEISEEYISYISTVEKNVFSSKENDRNHTRKYLGIVYSINGYNYYIPLSSPKNSDYRMENGVQKIRGSIVPIIRGIGIKGNIEIE